MGYQIYKVGNRWGGYGVPAICEYPECNREIDRGISFACGGEPFSEHGCDRYFCSEHRQCVYFNPVTGKKCRHKRDCNCDEVELCERCANGKMPFPYKPEVEEWIKHLLTDKSWGEWRIDNPDEVKYYKQELTKKGK